MPETASSAKPGQSFKSSWSQVARLVCLSVVALAMTIAWISLPLHDPSDARALSPHLPYVIGYNTYWALVVGSVPCVWVSGLLGCEVDLRPAFVMLLVPGICLAGGLLGTPTLPFMPIIVGCPSFGVAAAVCTAIAMRSMRRKEMHHVRTEALKALGVLSLPPVFWLCFLGLSSVIRRLSRADHWGQTLLIGVYPFFVLSWRLGFQHFASKVNKELTLISSVSLLASIVGTVYGSFIFPDVRSVYVYVIYLVAKCMSMSIVGIRVWRRHRKAYASVSPSSDSQSPVRSPPASPSRAADGAGLPTHGPPDLVLTPSMCLAAPTVAPTGPASALVQPSPSRHNSQLHLLRPDGDIGPAAPAQGVPSATAQLPALDLTKLSGRPGASSGRAPGSPFSSGYESDASVPGSPVVQLEHLALQRRLSRTLSNSKLQPRVTLTADARAVTMFATHVFGECFVLLSVPIVACVARYGNNASYYPIFSQRTFEQFSRLFIYTGITLATQLVVAFFWMRYLRRATGMHPIDAIVDLAEHRGSVIVQNLAFAFVFPLVVLTPHNGIVLE